MGAQLTVSSFEASACEEWRTCCKRLHGLAVEREESTAHRDCDDLELTSLVEEARKAPPELRRMFSKRIWRIRRRLRTQRDNACLIPKTPASKLLKSYRPVSSLASVRKLWGTREWNFWQNWSSKPSKPHSSERLMRHSVHCETCCRAGQRMERTRGGHPDRPEKGVRQNASRDCHTHDEEERSS